ncbi:N-acetyl sugar amidotransferase [Campylobacter vicugnae]|uniref:N-acetyl sugar amidotransferase n=1 Tax=Campylobacter vicugnae TaxID=1660076 RepID=UPI000A34A058|nr:N-acetyl sugar amidotransferase [Campylobacter sp. S0112]
MEYCSRCLQPNTRPGVVFKNGICGACLWQDESKIINWKTREDELKSIAQNAKLKAKGAYDCVIGVSGGKDSTFQAFYARDILGLRVLLVNCEPMDITPIGRANFENLKRHGFETISINPNRNLAKKLMKKAFYEYLNPVKPLEYTLYASAYIIADMFNIPMILQGENAALTLGAKNNLQDSSGNALNIVNSNTLKDNPIEIYMDEETELKDLFLYKVPVDELTKKGVTAVWLNYYTDKWSMQHNAKFAIERGLSIYPKDVNPYDLGTYRRCSQLDTYMTIVNQYFKYIKFGFGQCSDHVAYDLRNKNITKDEGKYLLRELDGQYGEFYMQKMASYLDLTPSQVLEYCEKFRGNMFEQCEDGWKLKNPIWQIEPIKGNHNLKDIMQRLEF